MRLGSTAECFLCRRYIVFHGYWKHYEDNVGHSAIPIKITIVQDNGFAEHELAELTKMIADEMNGESTR